MKLFVYAQCAQWCSDRLVFAESREEADKLYQAAWDKQARYPQMVTLEWFAKHPEDVIEIPVGKGVYVPGVKERGEVEWRAMHSS